MEKCEYNERTTWKKYKYSLRWFCFVEKSGKRGWKNGEKKKVNKMEVWSGTGVKVKEKYKAKRQSKNYGQKITFSLSCTRVKWCNGSDSRTLWLLKKSFSSPARLPLWFLLFLNAPRAHWVVIHEKHRKAQKM
jgi:hypothetical protein